MQRVAALCLNDAHVLWNKRQALGLNYDRFGPMDHGWQNGEVVSLGGGQSLDPCAAPCIAVECFQANLNA